MNEYEDEFDLEDDPYQVMLEREMEEEELDDYPDMTSFDADFDNWEESQDNSRQQVDLENSVKQESHETKQVSDDAWMNKPMTSGQRRLLEYYRDQKKITQAQLIQLEGSTLREAHDFINTISKPISLSQTYYKDHPEKSRDNYKKERKQDSKYYQITVPRKFVRTHTAVTKEGVKFSTFSAMIPGKLTIHGEELRGYTLNQSLSANAERQLKNDSQFFTVYVRKDKPVRLHKYDKQTQKNSDITVKPQELVQAYAKARQEYKEQVKSQARQESSPDDYHPHRTMSHSNQISATETAQMRNARTWFNTHIVGKNNSLRLKSDAQVTLHKVSNTIRLNNVPPEQVSSFLDHYYAQQLEPVQPPQPVQQTQQAPIPPQPAGQTDISTAVKQAVQANLTADGKLGKQGFKEALEQVSKSDAPLPSNPTNLNQQGGRDNR